MAQNVTRIDTEPTPNDILEAGDALIVRIPLPEELFETGWHQDILLDDALRPSVYEAEIVGIERA